MQIEVHAIHIDTVRKIDLQPLREHMPARMERSSRFRFERDRLLSAGAGFLLMNAAGVRDEALLSRGEHGKPFAPGLPAFNLSHSGSWCILARGSDPIGADIERIDEAHLKAARSVLTEEERSWMEASPCERFFTLWTWKESVMKASGLGMTLKPSSFSALPFAHGDPVRLVGSDWYARGFGLDDCRVSVCAAQPVGGVSLFEWGADGSKKRENIHELSHNETNTPFCGLKALSGTVQS